MSHEIMLSDEKTFAITGASEAQKKKAGVRSLKLW